MSFSGPAPLAPLQRFCQATESEPVPLSRKGQYALNTFEAFGEKSSQRLLWSFCAVGLREVRRPQ
jgi:hypothetical protein